MVFTGFYKYYNFLHKYFGNLSYKKVDKNSTKDFTTVFIFWHSKKTSVTINRPREISGSQPSLNLIELLFFFLLNLPSLSEKKLVW